MARFRKAEKQAAWVMKQVQGTVFKSVRTVSNYEERLKQVAEWCRANKTSLQEMTVEQAHQYLTDRAVQVSQKTLDMERQAIQAMMQHVTGKLGEEERLTVIKSEHKQVLESRAYTREQVAMIAQHQTERNALATEIAYAAGLRAHELLTLQRIEERRPDKRPAHEGKFRGGREGVAYTVHGKGGLVREVRLPAHLAERLEARRLDAPRTVTDRGVHYQRHYDIGGGNSWSSSFTRASQRALGWSTGAHGLRHSYAQERMDELGRAGYAYDERLRITSQEMGHFRPDITEVYLR